jgi:hypothetical protein
MWSAAIFAALDRVRNRSRYEMGENLLKTANVAGEAHVYPAKSKAAHSAALQNSFSAWV